jgi:hypothetical protein
LAVQCTLRTDSFGRVRFPVGLLRGMRLGSTAAPWHELEDAHWLTRPFAFPAGHVTSQLLDPLGPLPARRRRARAADWALRTTRIPGIRDLEPIGALIALALAAHSFPEHPHGIDREVLCRTCGLTPAELARSLDRLQPAGQASASAAIRRSREYDR